MLHLPMAAFEPRLCDPSMVAGIAMPEVSKAFMAYPELKAAIDDQWFQPVGKFTFKDMSESLAAHDVTAVEDKNKRAWFMALVAVFFEMEQPTATQFKNVLHRHNGTKANKEWDAAINQIRGLKGTSFQPPPVSQSCMQECVIACLHN